MTTPVPADHRLPASPPPRRKARSWIITLVVLVILAGGAFAAWRWYSASKSSRDASTPKARPVPVVAVKATKGDLPVYLNGLGTTTAFNTVTIRTRVDGELIKVGFTEGQMVKEGDLLAQIDPRPFEVQLAQAQGQLAKDQASLNNARLDLKRYEDAREAVPSQQIDTAASTVAQFEGAVRIDQAQIDNAQLQLTYCKITAPINGRVGLRLVDAGNMIHASDANGLVVITQLQPIAVQFSLPQDNLPAVLKGEAAGPLTAEAYDRDLKTKLATGHLLAIDNQIDTTTGTCRMKAEFANEDSSLFPNQFVNIRLLVDTQHGVVLAPIAAVQRSPQGTFVYVVKGDESVEVRQVTTGLAEGDTTVINDGLAEGETVVTDGTDKLRAGTVVAARAPGAPAGRSAQTAASGTTGASGEASASGATGPTGKGERRGRSARSKAE